MKFDNEPSFTWGDRQTSGAQPCWRFRARKIGILATLMLSLSAVSFAAYAKDKHNDHDDDDEIEVEIDEKRSLRFGVVASSYDGPGTATISPDDAFTTTGYAIPMGGNPRAARYKIEGPKNGTVIITLPTSVTVYSSSGTATLSNFVSSPPAGAVQLNKKGKLTLKVGATLTVPAGQSGGRYRGHFTIYADPP